MAATADTRRTVLVTDAGRGSAVACIRSLGRAGYRVVAADADPGSAGFRSRYVSRRCVVPDPQTDAAGFCAALYEAVRAEKVQLLVPVTDLSGLPLARDRVRFESITRLALPSDALLEWVNDKDRTLALARQLGIAVPRGGIAHTIPEALALAGETGWPLVLKPRRSRTLDAVPGVVSRVVSYAADAAELQREWPCVATAEGVIVQQYCAGRGEGVEVLADGGEPLMMFQHRRRREVPVTGGASSDRQSVALDPALVDPALRLLRAMRWTGLAMVEFKAGAGAPVLMEINGRIWGSLPLAVAAGVDFPRGLAALFLDGPAAVPHPASYRIGLRARDLRRDLVWIGAVLRGTARSRAVPVPPRRAALGAMVELLDPTHRQDLFNWSDPWPALHELPRTFAALWHKAGGARHERGRHRGAMAPEGR